MAFDSADIENKETVRSPVEKDTDEDKEQESTEEPTAETTPQKVCEIDIKVSSEDEVELRNKTGEGPHTNVSENTNQKKRLSSDPDTPNSVRGKSVSPQKKSNVSPKKSPTKERKKGTRASPRLKNRLSPKSAGTGERESSSEREDKVSPQKNTKDKEEVGEGNSENKKTEGQSGEGQKNTQDSEVNKNPILRGLLNKPPMIQKQN